MTQNRDTFKRLSQIRFIACCPTPHSKYPPLPRRFDVREHLRATRQVLDVPVVLGAGKRRGDSLAPSAIERAAGQDNRDGHARSESGEARIAQTLFGQECVEHATRAHGGITSSLSRTARVSPRSRHQFVSPAVQLTTTVIGGAIASSATFIRNRPSRATAYCALANTPAVKT